MEKQRALSERTGETGPGARRAIGSRHRISRSFFRICSGASKFGERYASRGRFTTSRPTAIACFSSINGSSCSLLYFSDENDGRGQSVRRLFDLLIKDLMKVIRDEQQNPISACSASIVTSVVADRSSGFGRGVDCTPTSQIIPGLTLCRLIKEHAPELHVTVGEAFYAPGG